jgi:uncharacterized protein YaaQ
VFSQLAGEVDEALTEIQISWMQAARQVNKKEVTGVLFAVLQEEDVPNAVKALKAIDTPVVRMPSAGEFLGQRNATIMVGIPKGREEQIIRALQEASQQRVQILASGEAAPSDARKITVGATLFSFDVERYEEF